MVDVHFTVQYYFSGTHTSVFRQVTDRRTASSTYLCLSAQKVHGAVCSDSKCWPRAGTVCLSVTSN